MPTFSRYEDIKKNHEIKYLAGGASQNAARGAAVSACCLATISYHPNAIMFQVQPTP